MKITQVEYSNLEFLVNTICDGKTNKEHPKDLGPHINNIYNHVAITFFLEEVDIITAYYLKQFSHDNTVIIRTLVGDELIDIKDKEFRSLYDDIHSTLMLTDIIAKDNDVDKKSYIELFPAICLYKTMTVTFTGSALGFLFGATPDLMLREVYQIEKNDNFNAEYILENKDKLTDKLVITLMESTYKFIHRENIAVDLLADSAINQMYKEDRPINASTCRLIDVTSIAGYLYYKGEPIFYNFDKTNRVLENVDTVDLMKKTMLSFSLKIPFYAYLEMFLYLPSEYFLDRTDVKVILAEDDYETVYMHIPEKYRTRLSNRFVEIITGIKNIMQVKDSIQKYYFVPLTSSIRCSMKISLYDIANVIDIYKTKIENGMYGDLEYNYLSKYIIDVLNQMINYSKNIYKIYFEK